MKFYILTKKVLIQEIIRLIFKLKNILGYECQFSVDDGIKEIIENLQNHKNNSSEKDINFGNYKIKI